MLSLLLLIMCYLLYYVEDYNDLYLCIFFKNIFEPHTERGKLYKIFDLRHSV